MDAMQVSSDSPQEDEFALQALGAPSFYDVMLCPPAWRELLEVLSESHGAGAARVNALQEFAAFLRLRDPRPLLLKSPTHSFAMPGLLHALPGTRALYIVRPWRECTSSNYRMWRAMLARYSLAPWSDADVRQMVVAAYVKFAAGLERLAGCTRDRVAAIHYVQLANHPAETLANVQRWLGIEFDSSAVERAAARVAAGRELRAASPDPYEPGTDEIEALEVAAAQVDRALAPFMLGPAV